MNTPFQPHPLLRQAHAQTTLPALLRRTPHVDWQIERLELPDGDFIDIGHLPPPDASPNAPIAMLLHGLGGGLDSTYLCATALRLRKRGWHCIGVQQRGAGPEPNRFARSYNHGASEDIAWLLKRIAQRYPQQQRAAIGWSLGGNVLLKALGEMGADAPLNAAAAVSVPFLLAPCVDHLQRGAARAYQSYLLRGLKASLRRKHGPVPLPPGANLEAALAAGNFRDFDNAYTAPCNDYTDAEDYYERAACGQYLGGIRVPTRIIHALDDPMMVPEIVPDPSSLPDSVELLVSPHGGHVGFVAAGQGGAPHMWLEHSLPEWLNARLRPAKDTVVAGECA